MRRTARGVDDREEVLDLTVRRVRRRVAALTPPSPVVGEDGAVLGQFGGQAAAGAQGEAGCPVCSSSADTVDGAVPHLNARDVMMLYISRAPLEKLQAYRRRMGWSFPWVSSRDSDFNFDFGVSAPEEQVSPLLEAGILPWWSRWRPTAGPPRLGT